MALKDLDHSFQALKKVTLSILFGSFAVIGLLVWFLHLKDKEKGTQVYVVTDVGTFSAIRKESRDISVYEVRNLLKTFLHTMFAHDAGTYLEKVEAGLHLIDKEGGKRIVHDFNKGEVYQNYVRLGTYTTITVDSVVVEMQDRPISGKAYARQTIHLGEKKKEFPIGIRFKILESYRSEQNPYGLLIHQFDYILYEPKLPKKENATAK